MSDICSNCGACEWGVEGGLCEDCRDRQLTTGKSEEVKSNREEVRLTKEGYVILNDWELSMLSLATNETLDKTNLINTVSAIVGQRLALQSAEIEALKSQIQGIKDRLSVEEIEKALRYGICVPEFAKLSLTEIAEAIKNKLEG